MFQVEDTENVFNKIMGDNFPNIRKLRYKRHTEHQNREHQNKNSSHYIIWKPIKYRKQRKYIENCKREGPGHIQGQAHK